MEILKALKKAAENSAKYQKERIEALKENPVVKTDWIPSEYAFVADLYYYLRHILGEDKSKRLILETTPYISDKNMRGHSRPDLSYKYKNESVVVEVKTQFHIKKDAGLEKGTIEDIQADCKSFKILTKNDFKKGAHIVAFINTKKDFKSKGKEVTESLLEKEVKKACKCNSEILVCLSLADV